MRRSAGPGRCRHDVADIGPAHRRTDTPHCRVGFGWRRTGRSSCGGTPRDCSGWIRGRRSRSTTCHHRWPGCWTNSPHRRSGSVWWPGPCSAVRIATRPRSCSAAGRQRRARRRRRAGTRGSAAGGGRGHRGGRRPARGGCRGGARTCRHRCRVGRGRRGRRGAGGRPGYRSARRRPGTVRTPRRSVDVVRRVAPRDERRAAPARARAGPVVLADAVVPDPTRVAALHRDRVAHLPVRLRDGIGVVGPLVLPGRSACLGCVELHRRGRDPGWPARHGPARRTPRPRRRGHGGGHRGTRHRPGAARGGHRRWWRDGRAAGARRHPGARPRHGRNCCTARGRRTRTARVAQRAADTDVRAASPERGTIMR